MSGLIVILEAAQNEIESLRAKLEAAECMKQVIAKAFKKFPVQLDGNVVMGMHAYNEIVHELNKAFEEFDYKG